MSSEGAREWLIKMGLQVKGPFDKNEVIALLRRRELGANDKISRPFHRWRRVCEEALFAKALEEIRVADLQGTETHAKDNTLQDNLPQDHFSQETPSQESHDKGVRSYGIEGDSTVLQAAKKSSQRAWYLVALLVMGWIGYYGFDHWVLQPSKQSRQVKEMLLKAERLLELGQRVEALDLFENVHQWDPQNPKARLFLGALYVQTDQQLGRGEPHLRAVIRRDLNRGDVVRARTALGLAHLYEGDLDRAHREFEAALDLDPSYIPAQVNRASVEAQQKKYDLSERRLMELRRTESHFKELPLLVAEILIQRADQNDDTGEFARAERWLVEAASQSEGSPDFLLEAQMLGAYAGFRAKAQRNWEDWFKEFLDSGPHLTPPHRGHLFIYHERISWGRLSQMCLEILDQVGTESAHGVALRGYCEYKQGNLTKALALAERALNQSPSSPLLLSVYALVLKGVGNVEQARAMVSAALRKDLKQDYRLPLYLQTVLCDEQGGFDCSQKNSHKRVMGESQ